MPPPGLTTAPNPFFLGTREGLILGVCNSSPRQIPEPLQSISQSPVSQAEDFEGVEINQQDGLTADLEAVQPA